MLRTLGASREEKEGGTRKGFGGEGQRKERRKRAQDAHVQRASKPKELQSSMGRWQQIKKNRAEQEKGTTLLPPQKKKKKKKKKKPEEKHKLRIHGQRTGGKIPEGNFD